MRDPDRVANQVNSAPKGIIKYIKTHITQYIKNNNRAIAQGLFL